MPSKLSSALVVFSFNFGFSSLPPPLPVFTRWLVGGSRDVASGSVTITYFLRYCNGLVCLVSVRVAANGTIAGWRVGGLAGLG